MLSMLTALQREVLIMLAQGKDPPEIADALEISEPVVLDQVRQASLKLGTPTTVETVVAALQRGQISLDEI